MAIKFRFDSERFVETPAIILANRNGNKLGSIPPENIHYEENMNSANNISFKVTKSTDGNEVALWDEIKDLKLIWCKEWDAWFEISVEVNQGDELIKTINGTSIGESELSAIYLYEMEVNTEDDIDTKDYVPTVLYNPQNTRGSLLHRILEKAPHYTIKHVDASIASIQRTYTFDGTSIYDAFQEIAEEIECLFIISQTSNDDGLPERGIYVYDLLDYCNNCGNRGNFNGVCDECSSTNITEGYGNDTTIFITNENLSREITFTTDIDQVKNCFRLVAGDDLMTASVISLNPNGTQYLWYVSDEQRADMSDELIEGLEEYDEKYQIYTQSSYVFNPTLLNNYNTVINKYKSYNPDLANISNSSGFENLITALYNTIDAESYIQSELMPTIQMSNTSASQQASKLTANALSPLAVSDLNSASQSTVELNLLSLAKAIINPSYSVKTKNSSYNTSNHTWSGKLVVTNYSDDEDTAETSTLSITVSGDYDKYVKQKIDKILHGKSTESYDIYDIFQKTLNVSGSTYSGAFMDAMHDYSLDSLKTFHSVCQSCLDILVEEGISDSNTWLNYSSDLYTQFYTFYFNRLNAIQSEINVRENEVKTVHNMYNAVINIRDTIQKALDFKENLGNTLWKEFCAYRRESEYKNDNYISDGLTNSEIIKNAKEFLNVATKELVKSATLQHSISSSLFNLLVIPEFNPLLDSFELGNWLRIKLDGEIYKLRLISYSVDFDNLDELNVDFSDVMKIEDDISDIESILKQSSSMASTYNSVERQSEANTKTKKTVDTWFEDGLNITLTKLINSAFGQTMTWDEHGMLMRKYDEPSDTYEKEQLKIINSTIAITDDNWKTTKTAIGKFYFKNPATGEIETAYGINAETLVGKVVIGSSLALYNESGNLTFNNNGLSVTNNTNTFNVNPNDPSIVKLLKGTTPVFSLDASGNLTITGEINSITGNIGGWTIGVDGIYNGTNSMTSTTAGIFIGQAGIRVYKDASNYINIDKSNGKITANNVDISGKIVSTTGEIGGFEILSNYLRTKNVVVTSNADNSVSLASGDTTFYRQIGDVTRYDLKFAIGGNFGVTKSGVLYCGDIVIHRAYRVYGQTYSDSTGVIFDIIRGNGISYGNNGGTSRAIGIGTNYMRATDYNYEDVFTMPDCGIEIKQNTGQYATDNGVDGVITITADHINLMGRPYSNLVTYRDTKVSLMGDMLIYRYLHVGDGLIYSSQYEGSISTRRVLADEYMKINNEMVAHTKVISKATEYTIESGKGYILAIWHNSSIDSRGFYIIKGGNTGVFSVVSGANLSVTVTVSGSTTKVKFDDTTNNPTAYLMQLN